MTDELHIRQSTQIGVDYPQRTIELVVVPYDSECITDQPYGRPVFESVSAGAFAGIERRANRIRVNRDHLAARTVGRALSLHPSRTEGLVAKVRIAKTGLGDETLALADEGCLDASAAFRPLPGGEAWNRQRDRVQITKAWLAHIGMTPDPAYEGANVLAVRHEAPVPRAATPNLDQIRALRLAERYDRLGH
jgi:HK97 family phage prohead protease